MDPWIRLVQSVTPYEFDEKHRDASDRKQQLRLTYHLPIHPHRASTRERTGFIYISTEEEEEEEEGCRGGVGFIGGTGRLVVDGSPTESPALADLLDGVWRRRSCVTRTRIWWGAPWETGRETTSFWWARSYLQAKEDPPRHQRTAVDHGWIVVQHLQWNAGVLSIITLNIWILNIYYLRN